MKYKILTLLCGNRKSSLSGTLLSDSSQGYGLVGMEGEDVGTGTPGRRELAPLPPAVCKAPKSKLQNYYNYTALSDSWSAFSERDAVTERTFSRNTLKSLPVFLSTVQENKR